MRELREEDGSSLRGVFGSAWNCSLNLSCKFVGSSKLLNRGWVVQEQVLSPRVVHFARGQVFWECGLSRESEFCPSFLIQKPGTRPKHKPSLGLPSTTASRELIWRDVVNTYSQTVLTKPEKDKALAIAGLFDDNKDSPGTPEEGQTPFLAKFDVDEVHLPADWAFGSVLRTHLS